MEDAHWQLAMKKKIETVKNKRTWMVEKLPKGKKMNGCKWIY